MHILISVQNFMRCNFSEISQFTSKWFQLYHKIRNIILFHLLNSGERDQWLNLEI